MQTKLVKTTDYLLLIDEKKRPYQMEYYLDTDFTIAKATLSLDQYEGCSKILAHLPLNNAPILEGVDLLPNPFEEKPLMEKAIEMAQSVKDYGDYKPYSVEEIIQSLTTQQLPKQFSLEEMKKAFEYGKFLEPFDSFEDFIQSLSTQQLPEKFILGEGDTIEEQIKNGYYI